MNLLELLAATIFSSLIGSIHCVGMCGPFSVFAVGNERSQSGRWIRLGAYHLGRLSTYLTMGWIVSLIAWPIRTGLGSIDLSHTLGWFAGSVLVAIGVAKISASVLGATSVSHRPWIDQWTRVLVHSRKAYKGVSALASSYLWGLTSTLLPCGWLYIFLIASLSAPNAGVSAAMMIAFWLGTLPLLSVSAYSWHLISPSWQTRLQPMIGIGILSFGLFAMWNRNHVDYAHMERNSNSRSTLEMIRAAINAKLPCCVHSEWDDHIRPAARGKD